MMGGMGHGVSGMVGGGLFLNKLSKSKKNSTEN